LQPELVLLGKRVAELSTKLDVYEQILGKQKFLVGDVSLNHRRWDLTLADLFHFSLASFLASAGIDIMTSKGPNVTRY
ncbi:hypothetical protein DFH09DRAFT_879461, partial [Mycena vulgaris]